MTHRCKPAIALSRVRPRARARAPPGRPARSRPVASGSGAGHQARRARSREGRRRARNPTLSSLRLLPARPSPPRPQLRGRPLAAGPSRSGPRVPQPPRAPPSVPRLPPERARAGGGVCARHMGRPPPIGCRRLTRPLVDGRAGGAGRAQATPLGGARGRWVGRAGSRDAGPAARHISPRARQAPRPHLGPSRAATPPSPQPRLRSQSPRAGASRPGTRRAGAGVAGGVWSRCSRSSPEVGGRGPRWVSGTLVPLGPGVLLAVSAGPVRRWPWASAPGSNLVGAALPPGPGAGVRVPRGLPRSLSLLSELDDPLLPGSASRTRVTDAQIARPLLELLLCAQREAPRPPASQRRGAGSQGWGDDQRFRVRALPAGGPWCPGR